MLPEIDKLNIRFGEHIGAKDIRLASDFEEKIRKREEYIASLNPHRTRRYSLEDSLERQKEIIDVLQTADELGFGIDYMDLNGILALRHGTSMDNMFPYSKTIAAMSASKLINTEGSPNLRRALEHDLVTKIEGVIDSTNEPVTFFKVLERLMPEQPSPDWINSAFNLLDVLGRVTKLPTNSVIAGHPTMWLSPKYAQTDRSIPEWNIKYRLLLAFNSLELATISDLVKDKNVIEISSIHTELPYSGANLTNALDDLIQQGLVDVGMVFRRRTATAYSSTSKARQLLGITLSQNYLDDELRRLLLGEKYADMHTSEKLQLKKEKRIFKILGEYEEGESAMSLAARISDSETYVYQILAQKRDPLKHYLATTILTHAKYFDQTEQRGMQRYLEKRKI